MIIQFQNYIIIIRLLLKDISPQIGKSIFISFLLLFLH